MTINNVDVVHVEAFQGSFGALDDVFSGEAFIVGALAAPKDLGGNDDVGSLPPELANGLAHDLFRAAVGVDLGIVEEVDAVVAGAMQERLRLRHVQLVPEADSRSVRELAHSRPRFLNQYFLGPDFRFRVSVEREGGIDFGRRGKEEANFKVFNLYR